LKRRCLRKRSPLPGLLILGALSVALGCATGASPPTAEQGSPAEPQAGPETQHREPRTFRLGFWEIDLLAVDREPRGTTFRMLDFRILKLLEIGSGADYHSFSLAEIPDLLNVITTRHEGATSEHRFVDLQALALAALRLVRLSEQESETHLLKIPLVGSLYGHETDGIVEKQTILYLYRKKTGG
jgi:hypothetical protein